MRIQLTPASPHDRDDRGAVAIILVFMTVILIFFAAFATDFGMSFVSKRNLQNGADAGALTAANTYAQVDGTCAELLADTATGDAAVDAADSISLSNRADRILTTNTDATWTNGHYWVGCTATGQLEFGYRIGGTTDTILGGFFGSSRTAAERSAVASVGVPSKLEGLRPYMICIGDAERLRDNPSTVQTVYFPSCGTRPGNWYTVECPPPDDGGGNGVLEENTRNGCSTAINIVDTTSAATPTEIQNLLIAACTPRPRDSDGIKGCMKADTGNDMTSAGVRDAWQDLLGKDIMLPVFDFASVTGSGSNTRYPVKALMGVRVCGFKWQSGARNATGITTSGICSGAAHPTSPTQSNWLLLKYRRLILAGSSTPSSCPLGDPECDLGLRTVSLTQ